MAPPSGGGQADGRRPGPGAGGRGRLRRPRRARVAEPVAARGPAARGGLGRGSRGGRGRRPGGRPLRGPRGLRADEVDHARAARVERLLPGGPGPDARPPAVLGRVPAVDPRPGRAAHRDASAGLVPGDAHLPSG